jgi:hypothetical protein
MNVNTGELAALTEQVERLTVIVQDGYGPLIRTIDRLLGDDRPQRRTRKMHPLPKRHLRAVEDMR